MTISCKLCHYAIKSAKPENQAVSEVIKKMTTHLGFAHKEHAADLAAAVVTLQSLVATYMMFEYIEIPESETTMQRAYGENKDALFALLGSSPVGETAPAEGASGPVN
jgi:hypothetical protein